MQAHRTRRALWFSNVPLAVAIVGVAVWYLTDIRPAVSAVVDAPRNNPGTAVREVVRDFDREARDATGATLLPPVAEAELKTVYLRGDFQQMDPPHWPFTGPRPSGKKREIVDAPTPKPKGLLTHGTIKMVMFDEPLGGAVTFAFNGGKQTTVLLAGEMIRVPDGTRYELVSIKNVNKYVYDTLWNVYDNKGAFTLENVPVDNRKISKPDDPVRFRPDPDPGTGPEPDPEPAPDPVHLIAPAFTPAGPGRLKVEFNDGAAEWVRSGAARKSLETVKTTIAEDSEGNPIGIRIVDFGEAPLDRLQLRRGDIIVSIDDKPAASRADFILIAQALSPDTQSVEVVVDRYGRGITFDVDPRDPKNRRAIGQYAKREDR